MTQEQNSENSYILEGLLQEYHSIWLVDKNDLTFTLYRTGETTGAKKAFEIAFKLKTYDKILEAYKELMQILLSRFLPTWIFHLRS